MAANITLGTIALAADGKTLTGTLAGGTGTGYGPATGVTGVTVRKSGTGGEVYHQASATISGTTLTVNLDTPVPSGTTVVTDVSAASSNITDDGANTAQGQTGVATTNNSTAAATAFAITDASIVAAGIDPSTTSSLNGVTCTPLLAAAEVQFVATGTDLWALGYSFATGAFQVSVDGGAFGTPTHVASNIAVPLFSGLSDAAHTVVIKNATGSAYLALAGTFKLFGASPAIALPTGFGTTYSLKNTPAHISVEAPWWKTSSGGLLGIFADNNTCATFGFRARCDTIKIYGYLAGQVLSFQRDGVEIGPVTVTNSSAYGWFTVATGLDTSATHLYRIAGLKSPTLYRWSDVTATGGTGIDTSALANRYAAFFHGDSIVSAQFPDARAGDIYNLGLQIDIATGSHGTSGVKMPTNVTNIINGIKPDVFVACLGTNDVGASTAQATFESNTQSYLAAIRTAAPSAKIVVRAILPRGDASAGGVATYNGYLQNAIAAVADGNTVYKDFSTGFDPTSGVHTSDGLHPNATGYAVIKNNEVPYFLGLSGRPSYTTSGTSDTVTVTLGGGATFNGASTITLTASAGTITATATGGSITDNGTGTVIVTPAAGQTSFTYTASSTATIAYTNGQGWVNPADTEYVGAEDTTPPTASDWAVATAGDEITATLSEAGCTPASGSGGFTLGGTTATVASWAISGTTITLTLAGTVYQGETVTVSYDDATASGAIADAADNPLADIADAAVTNNSTATDTTPPTLTSPSATPTGATTARLTVTTDEGTGFWYAVVTASPTAPDAGQVASGKDENGDDATWASESPTAVTGTGVKTFDVTGLSPGTWYGYIVQDDGASNRSVVAETGAFVLRSGSAAVLGFGMGFGFGF